MTTTTKKQAAPTRTILNKVPEVTLYFWIIKVLCTTVGESAADFLNVNLNLGLTVTSVITGALLVVALVFQFRSNKYIPTWYWLTVALVSVFGTLVTDNLSDHIGLPLEASTVIFGTLLAVTFLVWYLSEKTLDIHYIVTRRRETFYWLAVFFSFALGTATGDLMAETLGLGYLAAGLIVAGLIAATAIAWKLGLNSVLCFWIMYILTRPRGAATGDYLSQPASLGGLGLGATTTSVIFLVGILAVVTYLSITKADVIETSSEDAEPKAKETGGLWQTVIVVSVLLVASGIGYQVRKSAVQGDETPEASAPEVSVPAAGGGGGAATPAAKTSTLGDLTTFRVITQDTLTLLNAGNQSGATTRIGDLEVEWDNGQARLKPKDKAKWTEIDGKIDTVLRELRSTNPNAESEKAALNALLASLG